MFVKNLTIYSDITTPLSFSLSQSPAASGRVSESSAFYTLFLPSTTTTESGHETIEFFVGLRGFGGKSFSLKVPRTEKPFPKLSDVDQATSIIKVQVK